MRAAPPAAAPALLWPISSSHAWSSRASLHSHAATARSSIVQTSPGLRASGARWVSTPVLAGTFVPIDGPPTADGFPGPRTWELRAGVVDTCTGQLLMRLYSQTCVEGAVPGQEANEAQCKRLTVTARQAMNPEMNVAAFQPPLDAMLYPLEHNATPAEEQGIEGTVTQVTNGHLTLKLAPGARPSVGDELSIHATRLAKNPLSYTLQNLHDQEIGRVSVTGVQGGVVTGSFAGEIPARTGDVAVHLAPPQQ